MPLEFALIPPISFLIPYSSIPYPRRSSLASTCSPPFARQSYDEYTAEPLLQAVVIPYLYIDKVFNELRDELLTAMHKAVDSELRNGRVDVQRLFRSFTRAAAKQMANPVQVSEKCVEANPIRSKKGSSVRADD